MNTGDTGTKIIPTLPRFFASESSIFGPYGSGDGCVGGGGGTNPVRDELLLLL